MDGERWLRLKRGGGGGEGAGEEGMRLRKGVKVEEEVWGIRKE